jgi:hypothetical protein
MGAGFENIEAYFVFGSDAHCREVFDNLEDDLKEIAKLFDFVNLHNRYLFIKDSAHMPYSDAGMVEAFFSVLSSRALWGQYFIESEELEISASYTKPLSHGLYTIAPAAPLQNIPDFTAYFKTAPGWRSFKWHGEQRYVRVAEVHTPDGTGFCVEQSPDANDLPHALTGHVLLPQNNCMYSITPSGLYGKPHEVNTLDNDAYFKEVFACTDETQQGSAYQLSEESGFYTVRVNNVNVSVSLDGILFTDCLVLEHDYLHVNCYKPRQSGARDAACYRCGDRVSHTYWQKNVGLVGISFFLDKQYSAVFTPLSYEAYNALQQLPPPGNSSSGGFFSRLFGKK